MPVIHGFELVREQNIQELNTRARLFRHIQTGAELLSLENDDENKVFCVTFRTPPADSTGVAHIMEHSVLCGSRKYPVKEPFVELVKGSLKTFVNAFTYPDKTCYPVASQNVKDFYNLIDVYMDAVFYPLIPEHILQQEGWRYELDEGNITSPLLYKGVVFNEMKGAYSDPDNLLARYTQQSLFPDILYGLDSGGDPRVIPNLTYEQFKAFHDAYYHPSNSRIFFYGDDDPDERLSFTNDYLKEFHFQEVRSGITLQQPFDQPRRMTLPYAVGEEGDGKKGMLTMSWLFPPIVDPEIILGMHILSYILVGTPASPLRKALIDSGLGEDLTGGGLESEFNQMFFATGLKGIHIDNENKIENLILDTLDTLVREGIDPDTVAAAINTTEFRLRENNTGSFPRGLLLLLRSLTTWLYDRDPLALLAFEAPLQSIQAKIAASDPFFETLISQYILKNPHQTTVVLMPDPQLRAKQEMEEKERLARIRQALNQDDRAAIIEANRRLKSIQETPDSSEALASIPVLTLADLDRQVRRTPLKANIYKGSQVLTHHLFTNKILYLDIGFNMHALPQEYIPYIPLFGRCLLEMGTEKEDFVRLSQRIGRSTGGIYPTTFTSLVRPAHQAEVVKSSAVEESTAWMYLRGKATIAHTIDLLNILTDIFNMPNLDNQGRFRQILLEEKAGMGAALLPAGHRMVNARLRATFNEADWAAEQMGGISYLYFLRGLAEKVDQDWASIRDDLQKILDILLNRNQMIFNLTLDEKNCNTIEPQIFDFISSLPERPTQRSIWKPGTRSTHEGLMIPAQVNYVGKGANLYQSGYELDGSILAITNYLRASWLWEQVRMRGGAYGVFCLFDHRSGVLTFLSYRDPNLLSTLDSFDQSASFLKELALSRDELTRSIIGAIGDMDAYQLPDARGYTSMLRYLAGDTDESRQRLRDELLDAGVDDFHAFGEILDRAREGSNVVLMGSEQGLDAAQQARQGWLEINRVL